MKKIHIGADQKGHNFYLPADLATGSMAMLATKGAGKSYTSAVVTEELIGLGVPVVILDPVGAHWGLKSSADGKSAGFPVTIFGGRRADLPLEEGAGEVLARLLVERRFCAILDFTMFKKAQIYRFLAIFLETFYQLNTEPIHLVCDEADAYAPQKPRPDMMRTLGAMEDIVRRGRSRGIGSTLITQRPASLNKDVLTQCETLAVLRVGHPRDIEPIMEWIHTNGDEEQAKLMVQSLPNLKTGTAWLWSPQAEIFELVNIRRRQTFDSSATPKIGVTRIEPKVFSKVDLAALGKEIAATLERAKENDPRELKSKISKLQGELAKAEGALKLKAQMPAPKTEVREVQIFDKEDRAALRKIGESHDGIEVHLRCLRIDLEKLLARIDERVKRGQFSKQQILDAQDNIVAEAIYKPVYKPDFKFGITGDGIGGKIERPVSTEASGRLAAGEQAVLIACAQFGHAIGREQLTALTGYKRSTRDAYIKRLRAAGYLDLDAEGKVAANAAGVSMLGNFQPLPTGPALRAYWLNRLPEGEAKILQILVAFHPHEIERETLSEKSGYLRSTRDAYLKRLAAKELLGNASAGHARASDNLF